MTKLLKILVSFIGALVLLFVIAGLSLAMYFDPNDYKNQISEMVYNKTGRHLQINGNIERSLFPWVGVKVHDVHLSNAAGFAEQPDFLNADEIDMQIEVLPLLSQKIEIAEVVLNGLELYLGKNKDGQTNWEDLTAPQAKNDPPPVASHVTTGKKLFNMPAFEWHMHQIKLLDSNIFWNDAQTGQRSELKNIELRANDIVLNKPFPIDVRFDLTSVEPALSGNFSFSAKAMISPATQQYHFDAFRLAQNAEGGVVPKFLLMADTVRANLKDQTLSVAHALLTSGNLTATIELQGEQITAAPVFKGRIQVAEFNLKNFLKSINRAYRSQDAAALQRVSIASEIEATQNSLKLKNLAMTLDDSLVKGEFNISDFSKKILNFALDINQINLDRYMASTTTAQNTGYSGFISAAIAEVTTPSTPVDMWSGFREMNASGSIHIGSLTLAKTVLTDVNMQPTLQNGVLQISSLTANAYQGKLQGQISVDIRGLVPQYTMDQNLSNIQMGQFLNTDRLSGAANIKAHIIMQGNSKQEILSSLNGNVQLNVANGSFIGFNLANVIDKAFEQISQAVATNPKNLPTEIKVQPEQNARTDFSELSASGVIQNGIFSNSDLLMQSPALKVTGSGTANLVTQTLDYRLNALGMHTTNGQMPRSLTLPILISGTFDNPIIMPDIRAIAGTLLRERIKQKLQQINTGATPIVSPVLREKAGKLLQEMRQ